MKYNASPSLLQANSFNELSEEAIEALEDETSTLVKHYVVDTLQKKYTHEFGDPVLYEKRLYRKGEENNGIFIYKVHIKPSKRSRETWEADFFDYELEIQPSK